MFPAEMEGVVRRLSSGRKDLTGVGAENIMICMDIRDRILDILEAAPGRCCSGEKLCGALNLSRAAVWKHIEGLREEGYPIDAAPSKGYWLKERSDIFSSRAIARRLTTGRLGRDIRFFGETTSTNAVAMSMAANGAPEGTLVVADSQTGGKGRLGRRWISPFGVNIYFSLILRPSLSPSRAHLVTMMTSVALATVLRQKLGVMAGIKWPNDILVDGKKLAGILTEMKAETDRVEYVVPGVGINVNWRVAEMPEEIRGIATSVCEVSGRTASRLELFSWLLEEMDRLYGGPGLEGAGLVDIWRGLSCTLGRPVRISMTNRVVEGIAENVDDDGRLVVSTDAGVEVVSAGDLEMR